MKAQPDDRLTPTAKVTRCWYRQTMGQQTRRKCHAPLLSRARVQFQTIRQLNLRPPSGPSATGETHPAFRVCGRNGQVCPDETIHRRTVFLLREASVKSTARELYRYAQ